MYIIKKGPTFFPPQLLLNPQITYKKKKGKKNKTTNQDIIKLHILYQIQ